MSSTSVYDVWMVYSMNASSTNNQKQQKRPAKSHWKCKRTDSLFAYSTEFICLLYFSLQLRLDGFTDQVVVNSEQFAFWWAINVACFI